MPSVVLDAGVVTRCRRRVHLEHDPTAQSEPLAPPDPAAQQRMADAADHRAAVIEQIIGAAGRPDWVHVDVRAPYEARVAQTTAALDDGAPVIAGALLPADPVGHRRGGAEFLVKTPDGYVPVIIVRHRISDPGQGARTTDVHDLDPGNAQVDPGRKIRSQPRDLFRLAHLRKLLETVGHAEPNSARGGVIGVDADVVVWHDLDAPTFPGDRSATVEYAARFADRLSVAQAAADGAHPLARPSRIVACKHCPWWTVCERDLLSGRDVSLVVRGDDAGAFRDAGVSTVDDLALLDAESANGKDIKVSGVSLTNAVALARAWQHDLTVVRKVAEVDVPRADVEVDVDMECYSEDGAYLWGALVSGVDIGVEQRYHAFVTWEPLPTKDEARAFAEFWTWFQGVRSAAADKGRSFKAYCYNALAENRWLLSSAQRFAGMPGVPGADEVREFISSDEWVDLFQCVSDSFLCAHGKGLKVVARQAGFRWRDPEAGGEASMTWYRDAVGPDPSQRERLLEYNEDDVRATYVLREWMSSDAMQAIPTVDELRPKPRD